jgi:small GTP-binding protein
MGKAILMTLPGSAAIAVVRLWGQGAEIERFLSHFTGRAAGGRCVHGELRAEEGVIDDPVIVRDPEGRWIDVNLHGGPWVVKRAMDLAAGCGFDPVERPGVPLPEEAVDGQTAIEREVLRYLPLARTELAVRVLLNQIEAWGDARGFAKSRDALGGGAAPLPGPLPKGRGSARRSPLYWLLFPPRVAIVGEANVGKSTLANQLFGQERSIVADLPGTTRDWVGEIANLDGLAVMLVDTPGLRETSDPIEAAAIERAGEQIGQADLIVQVFDRRFDAPSAIEGAIYVVNKIDLSDTPAPPHCIATVATTGQGVDALRRAIRDYFGIEGMDEKAAYEI